MALENFDPHDSAFLCKASKSTEHTVTQLELLQREKKKKKSVTDTATMNMVQNFVTDHTGVENHEGMNTALACVHICNKEAGYDPLHT